MEITKFVWSDEYSVGVAAIDDQHKHFFEIVNKIYDLLEKQPVQRAELIFNVTELGNYAMYHLSTEEKYFKQFDYDGAELHIEQHNLFRDKVTDYMSKIQDPLASVDSLAVEMADFAKNWLMRHILVMDKKYTECFKEHGLA